MKPGITKNDMMNAEFDLSNWSSVANELKRRYPHLTNADLMWRHETKRDFYKMIASELGMTTNELEQIITQLDSKKQ